MKKINKFLSVSVVLSILSVCFTACFNPAFYQINQDVEPEDSNVSGSINSIARYTVGENEYLVLAGGEELSETKRGLLYKIIESDPEADSNQHGKWQTYPVDQLPFELHHYDYYGEQNHVGEQIIKVLAGSEYLYLVTAEYTNNSNLGTSSPSKINIWAAKIDDWTTSTSADWTNLMEDADGNALTRDDGILYLPLYDGSKYTFSAFNVFSTNAPIQANRSVYLRSGNLLEDDDENYIYPPRYYKIDGLTISEITGITFLKGSDSALVEANTSSDTTLINTVVNVNETDIFFSDSNGVTTNETYSTPATMYYASYDESVFYGTGYSDPTLGIDVGSSVASLAYCKDALLIGCGDYSSSSTSDGGIEKVQLNNDIPESSTGTFETNAQSQLLSSYIVMTIINATPENSELDSTLYASTNFAGTASSTQATFKNIGLWSYYASRGNWNKE